MKKGKNRKQFLIGWICGLALCATLVVSGCAVRIKTGSEVEGFCYKGGIEKDRAKENYEILKDKYWNEWKLNRKGEKVPPYLGLAMSGGGMRSAAFNIGVLKGLHKLGELQKIDIISSVSGGSYAMSWYYLQKFNARVSDDILFHPDKCFQRHLEENGRLITHSNNGIIQSFESLIKLGTNVVVIPVHWFANLLFDWKANLAPYRWYYQNAIEREFHLTPNNNCIGLTEESCIPYTKDKCTGFKNETSFLGLTVGVKKGVNFTAMKDFIEENSLPSFVINTTATISDDMDHYGADFSNTNFEFTPYFFGSDAYGYYKKNFPIDIQTAVAVSGAAVDHSVFTAKLAFMYSILNIDLGYNIPNYDLGNSFDDIRRKLHHYALPAPFYFFYRGNNDMRSPKIHLTDGGHNDNLGAFALVRRMCKHIIIVDAEHDPDYRFAAYHKLKTRLRKELGVDFSLPDIDEINEDLNEFFIDFKGNESLYKEELPKKLAEELIKNMKFSSDVKIEYDKHTMSWWITGKNADGEICVAMAKKVINKLYVKWLFDGSKPIMKGKISWFPLKIDKEEPEKVEIDVTYIKLSLNPKEAEKEDSIYPKNVIKYYKTDNRNFFKKITGWQNTPFPHEDTSDISYGKDQFRAYRDLGCYIVTTFYHEQAPQ